MTRDRVVSMVIAVHPFTVDSISCPGDQAPLLRLGNGSFPGCVLCIGAEP